MKLFTFFGVLLMVSERIDSQHVAPGVPPQKYQQQQYHPSPQQQYQQVPVQQYQQPQGQFQQQQYQQPQHQQQQHQQPQHQQQQQQQHQQQQQQQFQQPPPQQAGHQHGHNHGQKQQILNAANMEHEREHIAEHMEVPMDTSQMTEQELQFHYFKMHDSDNNNKLDGCELIKSLIHWHEANGTLIENAKSYPDDLLSEGVDANFLAIDANNDGFIEWTEFKATYDMHHAKASRTS